LVQPKFGTGQDGIDACQ